MNIRNFTRKTVLVENCKAAKKFFTKLKGPMEKKVNIVRGIVLVVLISVLFYSLFMIGKKMYGYYHDNKQYKEIRSKAADVDSSKRFAENIVDITEASVSDGTLALPYKLLKGNTDELNSDGILSEYAALKKENNDLIGWIQMPGFRKVVDYPVMQSESDAYYLDKDFYGNYSYAGSIFMDSRNNPRSVDRNIIIYGHAMNDHSMFGNLKDYPNRPGTTRSLQKSISTS